MEEYGGASFDESAMLERTHELLRLLGKPVSLIRHVTDRPGHDRRYAIDCSKIERELGWRPEVGFEEGLAQTVEWYRANQRWIHSALARTSRARLAG